MGATIGTAIFPGDDIPYEEFRKLAFDYAERILLGSPVVLNNLYCYPLEPVEGILSEDDCVKQYIVQGGTPHIRSEKRVIYRELRH